jgi:hypothetical protein
MAGVLVCLGNMNRLRVAQIDQEASPYSLKREGASILRLPCGAALAQETTTACEQNIDQRDD